MRSAMCSTRVYGGNDGNGDSCDAGSMGDCVTIPLRDAEAAAPLARYPLPADRNGHIVRPALLRSATRNGRPEYLKELNTLLVLEMFRNQGSLSRAEVARRTGISAPTVSKIVEKLVE